MLAMTAQAGVPAMVPYAPYVFTISLTAYVITLIAMLAVSAAYLALAQAADRRRLRTVTASHHPLTPGVDHVLRGRVMHSRLVKMMRRLDVNPADYLHRVPEGAMRAQIETCTACPHQFLCDEALAAPRNGGQDLSFCPNRAPLLALAPAA